MQSIAILALVLLSATTTAAGVAAQDAGTLRAWLLPLRDRATLVIELTDPVTGVKELAGEQDSLVVELGPVRGPVSPTELKPPMPSAFMTGVLLTGVRGPDGTLSARVSVALSPGTRHIIRTVGRHLYIDLASQKRTTELPREDPGLDAPVRIPAKDSYPALRSDVLGRAPALAAKPDVKGLLRLEAEVRARDEKLGQAQPDLVDDLIAEIQQLTEAARARQLELDRRALLRQPSKP